MNQNDQILEYLKQGHTLTALEALQKFGSFRLASRISDLKRSGYKIISERVKLDTGKNVAQYRLDFTNQMINT